MNRYVGPFLLSVALMATSLFPSCAPSAKVAGSWTDQHYAAKPMNKFLCLGMAKDGWVRRKFETTLATDISKAGAEAIASTEVVATDEKLTRDLFEEKFRQFGIDGVLVSRVMGEENRQEAKYDLNVYAPAVGYLSFYSFYSTAYDYAYVYGPNLYGASRVSTETIATIETVLYETKEGKIVWRAVSESVDQKKATDLIVPLSSLIVSQLRKDGFLKQ